MVVIKNNIDLKPFNTFGISAIARHYVAIGSAEDLINLIETDLYKNEKRLILGGGSNILLTKNFEGLVIHNNLKGIQRSTETDDYITLAIGSGEDWHPFVMHCIKNNWGGVENLSLIPGTVGAAPMQNIGAYGVEIKEVVEKVEGIDLTTGESKTYTNSQCKFGYRESVFKSELKEKIFISSVTLTLSKKTHLLRTDYGAINTILHEMNASSPTIQTISEAVIKIRKQKLPNPAELGNSGSFFKNPSVSSSTYESLKKSHSDMPGYPSVNQTVKIPAAWLIEQCGWKGKRTNDAGVHHEQALVLVNFGNATGKEILDLSMLIRSDVYKKFHIKLTPEVNII